MSSAHTALIVLLMKFQPLTIQNFNHSSVKVSLNPLWRAWLWEILTNSTERWWFLWRRIGCLLSTEPLHTEFFLCTSTLHSHPRRDQVVSGSAWNSCQLKGTSTQWHSRIHRHSVFMFRSRESEVSSGWNLSKSVRQNFKTRVVVDSRQSSKLNSSQFMMWLSLAMSSSHQQSMDKLLIFDSQFGQTLVWELKPIVTIGFVSTKPI